MAAIKAGGKKIVFRKGRKPIVTDRKSSSSKSSSKSSSSSSSSNSGSSSSSRLFAEVENLKTGEKGFLVDGKIVSEKPKSSGGSSSSSPTTGPPIGNIKTTAVDSRTGVVQEKVFSPSGKIISNRTRVPTQQELNKSLEGMQFNNKVLSNLPLPQQRKLLNEMNLKTQQRLAIIDANKRLSPIQKETEKRRILGIAQIKPTEQRTLNTISRDIRQKFNTLNAPLPTKEKNFYRKVEDKLSETYLNIANKPVNQRSNKEMLALTSSGLASTGLGILRKTPVKVLEFIALTFRPDIVAKGLFNLATDKETQSELRFKLNSLQERIKKGDPDAISEVASEILGMKGASATLRTAGKVASVTKPVRILKEAKFVLSQPKEIRPYVKQILKASRIQEKLKPTDLKGIKKINFNEVKELNKVEAKALKKTLQETDSFIFGSVSSRTLSKGKTKIPKDVDLATKNIKEFQKTFIDNLPKSQRKNYTISKESIKKGNTKILDIKQYNRLKPDQTIFGTGRLPINTLIYKTNKPKLKQSGLKIPTQRLVEVEGIKLVGFGEQTTRKALGTLQVILEKSGRRAKDPSAFIESLEIQLQALKGKIPKQNRVSAYVSKLKVKDLENAIKILKSKSFANLLEKKVPNLLKEYPILKKLKSVDRKKLSKNIKERLDNIRKRTTKKEALSRSKAVKKKLKTTKRKRTIKKTSKSKLPKSRVPKSRVPKSRTPTSRTPTSRTPTSRTPTSRTPTSKTPTSRTPTSRTPTSRTPTSRTPTGGSRTPTGGSRTPTGGSKTPPTKINFNSRSLTNRVATYEAKFRERRNKNLPFNKKTNPIVTKIIRKKTTKNRMLNEVAKRVDNSLARSITIKVIGLGNKKQDIKKPAIISKFRQKKSKNTPVLELVEKAKNLQDTKGEKREIKTIKRKAKKSPPKKRVSKVSKPKKTKNSSKNKPKRITAKKGKKKASKPKTKKVSKKTRTKMSKSSKKLFKTKSSAKKNLKKGQSIYKVKGGWKRTSI